MDHATGLVACDRGSWLSAASKIICFNSYRVCARNSFSVWIINKLVSGLYSTEITLVANAMSPTCLATQLK